MPNNNQYWAREEDSSFIFFSRMTEQQEVTDRMLEVELHGLGSDVRLITQVWFWAGIVLGLFAVCVCFWNCRPTSSSRQNPNNPAAATNGTSLEDHGVNDNEERDLVVATSNTTWFEAQLKNRTVLLTALNFVSSSSTCPESGRDMVSAVIINKKEQQDDDDDSGDEAECSAQNLTAMESGLQQQQQQTNKKDGMIEKSATFESSADNDFTMKICINVNDNNNKDDDASSGDNKAHVLEFTSCLCSICLSGYKVGDQFTWLRCNHTFHTQCLVDYVESALRRHNKRRRTEQQQQQQQRLQQDSRGRNDELSQAINDACCCPLCRGPLFEVK